MIDSVVEAAIGGAVYVETGLTSQAKRGIVEGLRR